MRLSPGVIAVAVLTAGLAACKHGVRAPPAGSSRKSASGSVIAETGTPLRTGVFEFRTMDLGLSYRALSFRLTPERLADARELGLAVTDWVVRLELSDSRFVLMVRREAGSAPWVLSGTVARTGIHITLMASDGSRVGAVKYGDAIKLARLPSLNRHVQRLEDDGFVLSPR